VYIVQVVEAPSEGGIVIGGDVYVQVRRGGAGGEEQEEEQQQRE